MYPTQPTRYRSPMEPSSQILPHIPTMRHKTPSLPVIHRSPSKSFQVPLFQSRHSTTTPPPNYRKAGNQEEDLDLTPRPLRINKLRKSPSVPLKRKPSNSFKKWTRNQTEGTPDSRSFMGFNFPPSPKQRSSSAGVLLKPSFTSTDIAGLGADKSAGNTRATSFDRTRCNTPGAGMAWLQRAKNAKISAPTDPEQASDEISPQFSEYPSTFRDRTSFLPRTRNSSSGATAGNSSLSSSRRHSMEMGQPFFTPVSDFFDNLPDRSRAVPLFSRPSITVENNNKDGNILDPSMEVPGSLNGNFIAESEEKTPTKGWTKRIWTKEFYTGYSGRSDKKKERDRSASNSSAKTTDSSSNSRPSTADATFSSYETKDKIRDRSDGTVSSKSSVLSNSRPRTMEEASSYGGSTRSRHAYGDAGESAWQLDGNDGSTDSSLEDIFQSAPRKVMNDSVVGILNGKPGGRGMTSRARQWKPPMLLLEVGMVAEVERMPVFTPKKSDQSSKEVWAVVEIHGKVEGSCGGLRGSGVGLDVGVLIDLSAYTSPDSFSGMKSQAKRIVEALEKTRDRVAVMTFSSTPNGQRRPSSHGRSTLEVLNSSGSVSRRQLIEDIANLVQKGVDIDPTGRDIGAAIAAAIKKIKSMPVDTTKYGTPRHAHLFLLTSKLDAGDTQFLPDNASFADVQIHILGLGPVFWPKSDMGGNGWCISTASLGNTGGLKNVVIGGLNIAVAESKPRNGNFGVEEVVSYLRTGVDLGELRDIRVALEPGEGCEIKAVMGGTDFSKILPGEERSLLVKIEIGDLPEMKAEVNTESDNGMEEWGLLERHLEATLGELKSRILTINVAYQHSNFSGSTSLQIRKALDISRFVEDSVWRLSPNGDIFPYNEVDHNKQPSSTNYEYVSKALIQNVANLHSVPRLAMKAVEEIVSCRAVRGVDFFEMNRELNYRTRLVERFKSTRLKEQRAPTSNCTTPPRASFESDNIYSTAPESRNCGSETADMDPMSAPIPPHEVYDAENNAQYYSMIPSTNRISKRNTQRPISVPLQSQSPTVESDAGATDSPDEARLLWRELKKNKQGGRTSTSINRRNKRADNSEQKGGGGGGGIMNSTGPINKVKDTHEQLNSTFTSGLNIIDRQMASGGMNTNGRDKRGSSGQDTLSSMLTLRDVRETDFGPWAM